MAEFNESKTTSFVGSVPVPMEMSTLGLCVGSTLHYEVEPITKLKAVAMNMNGARNKQPVVVTLGAPVTLAAGARSAIYHSLGLDSMAKEIASNKSNSEVISTHFASIFSRLGANNNYIKDIFEPKCATLREELLLQYPEQIAAFDNFINEYKNAFARAFGASKEDDKKKQIMM